MLSDDILTKLEHLARAFDEVEARMSDAALMASPEYQTVLQRHARLVRLIEPYRALRQTQADAEAAQELLEDPDLAAEAEAEIADCGARQNELAETIMGLLVQADSASDRPALLEIRAGTGGDEASLFAGDLLRMYTLFCQRTGWRLESLEVTPGEVGGVKEAIIRVVGEGAFGMLRFEAGGHRVQRVPATESQGRIHTSAATVAVMPEAEAVDVQIAPDDLRVDVFRASGAGGQHVNKTESAVRITHIPTGIVASCQDQKSQHANKDRAMTILRSRIYEAERQRLSAERAAERKDMVGTGDRSDRIRTYNYPQNRITDHRIGYTAHNLDRYVEGHLEDLQQAMIDAAKADVLAAWDGDY